MPARPTQTPRRRPCLTALLAIGLLAGLGSRAQGQSMRAGGEIGVSLTILRPVTTQAVSILSFDVDRNGFASVRTTAPAVGPVSHIVMATVSSASAGTTVAAPARRGMATPASPALGYVVDLGSVPPADPAGEPVQLRLQYLTVAGT